MPFPGQCIECLLLDAMSAYDISLQNIKQCCELFPVNGSGLDLDPYLDPDPDLDLIPDP